MTVSEIDDRSLEHRLGEAMQRIAADYQPSDVRRLAVAEPAPVGRLPHWGRRAATAVAAIVGLGVAAVWYVTESPSEQPSEPRTVTTTPPRFGDGFTLPEVEPMRWSVELDPAIDVGDFEGPNRFQTWLHSNEPLTTRFFVRAAGDRATATIIVDDYPAWTWSRHEAGVPYTDVDGLDARLDPDLNQVAWLDENVVRVAQATGSASDELAEVVEAAATLDDLANFEVPAGFEELSYRPFSGWQSSQSGWSLGVIQPAPGQAELNLAAFWALTDGVESIDGGWLRRDTELPGTPERWNAWVRVDDFIVQVWAPGYVDDEVMRNIASLIEVVPVATPERPFDVLAGGVSVEGRNPTAGGELVWGRWLAVVDVEAQHGRDVHCLAFTGAIDLRGCSDPGSAQLTVCGRLANTPNRVGMVTTEALDQESLPISVESGDVVVSASIEQSGGLTFAIAETDGVRGRLRIVDAAGSELCVR